MRLLFPHGLGDVIQALPTFELLAKKRGESLDIGVLERLPAACEVLEGLPFVEGIFGLEDPWRDFEPVNTMEGFTAGMTALKRKHGGTIVWTSRPKNPLDPTWCKAYRIAQELLVEWAPVCPALGQLWFDPEAVRARALVDEVGARYAMVHGKAGNPMKDVAASVLAEIAREADPLLAAYVIDPSPDETLAWNLGRIERAGSFVGIDSGPAHLASCTRTPVTWVFRDTPIQQAIPLWRDVDVVVVGPSQDMLVDWWEAWRGANASMVTHEVRVRKGARNV